MKAAKTLVLGAMPPEAAPDTHLAAGPWCFAGQEQKFPHWERQFTFAPEPFEDSSLPPLAAAAAECLCVRSMPAIAAQMAHHSEHLPATYWQTLLCPWAIDVAKQIVERALRCRAMLRQWRDQDLRVPVLPEDMAFDFFDEHDFTLHGALGMDFNHWLFSTLLAKNWPPAWKKVECAPKAVDKPPLPSKKSMAAKWRELARKLQLSLPFPKLKGMKPAQALVFSLALLHPCRQPDHSLNLETFAKNWPEAVPTLDDALAIFQKCLPRTLKNLRHPAQIPQSSAPRLRVASVVAYEDSEYRQKLARWRAAGNRLAYVQHGGNYGQVKVACDTQLVEYSQDVFFTWGWRTHGENRGNFVPLPYTQLAAIADKWHGVESDFLLFVGTEMAAFPYRLDSRPTPLQFLAYRQAKADFFEELGPELQKSSLYRPYFDLPGTFVDAAWLLPQFPNLRRCSGPLQTHLLGCRLLTIDHHGTTMLEALAADVPMILYWNPAHWPLATESERLLQILHEAGVWFDNPRAAAQKAREVWTDPVSWWQSAPIREARMEWCKNQALCDPENLGQAWINTLKQL